MVWCMEQIPDAPYIRDAEQNGYPSWEPVYCPVCGEECETIYLDQSRNVCGCDKCMKTQDAGEWLEEEKERTRPDWVDDR